MLVTIWTGLKGVPKKLSLRVLFGFAASQANPEWLNSSVFNFSRTFHLMKIWDTFFFFFPPPPSCLKAAMKCQNKRNSTRAKILWSIALFGTSLYSCSVVQIESSSVEALGAAQNMHAYMKAGVDLTTRYFHHKNQIALIKTLACQPASVWVPWSFRASRDFLLSLRTLMLKKSCLSKCFYYVGCYRCLKWSDAF